MRLATSFLGMLASTTLPAMLGSTVLATCDSTLTSLGICDSTPTPPNLVHLVTVFATENPPMVIGDSGYGNRLFIPISGGSFWGPKLQGKVAAAGGDWGNYNTAGTVFSPDAKVVLQTEDGASILMSGRGRSPYFGVDFETGSAEYAWLNALMCLGKITVGDKNLTAEIFEVV